jgi:hypothetical protein
MLVADEEMTEAVKDRKLFVDLDGMLADFDSHYEAIFGERNQADNVDWAKARAVKDFYLDIPPMADMQVLWARIDEARRYFSFDRQRRTSMFAEMVGNPRRACYPPPPRPLWARR